MKKELKDQVLETISAQLKQYPNFYITDIAGLNAEDTSKLRRACFEEGIKLTVVKNTLFRHVIKGMENEELIGDIISLLQSPMRNVISALENAGGTVAGIVKALEEKKA